MFGENKMSTALQAASPSLQVVNNQNLAGNPATATSPNPASRANARLAPSYLPIVLLIGVFGGLYLLVAWLQEKYNVEEASKFSNIAKYAMKLLTLFIAVVLAMNLGKILVGKLVLWTKNIPMVNQWFHYLAIVVGNA